MTRLILISSLFILLFAISSFAQSSSCVEGDFLKGFGSPNEPTINRFYDLENKFCVEIKEHSNLQAIYGFVSSPKFGRIVRVYEDKVVYTNYENDIRYQERELTREEFSKFENLLTKIKPQSLEPIRDSCTDNCIGYEFLSINQSNKHRLFLFAGYFFPPNPMLEFADLFREWQESGNFKVHYYIHDKIKDLKLLFADNTWSAQAVFKKEDDFRILVRDDSKSQENFRKSKEYFDNSIITDGKETYKQRLNRLKRRNEIDNSHYSWHKFENGRLGKKIAAPTEIPYFEEKWKFSANGYEFRNPCINNGNDCALVKLNNSDEVTFIRKGDYVWSHQVVSPDGKWMVASKQDKATRWEDLIRVNLLTGEESKIDIKTSSRFQVLAYVGFHKKFVVRQFIWQEYLKPYKIVNYLIDASTGNYEEVTGDFVPLVFADKKPLQPTKIPNVFWAAKHDYKGNTQFGTYDTKSFTFTPIASWYGIEFNSDSMWVNEKDKKIYCVYDGHLLSLPLPKEKNHSLYP